MVFLSKFHHKNGKIQFKTMAKLAILGLQIIAHILTDKRHSFVNWFDLRTIITFY
jgi:hypothetical protein